MQKLEVDSLAELVSLAGSSILSPSNFRRIPRPGKALLASRVDSVTLVDPA
jgi:hypothetical protein